MLRAWSGFVDWPRRGVHPRSSRWLTVRAVIAVLVALAVGGCGGSAGPSSSSSTTTPTTAAAAALPPVCAPAALAVIRRAFGVAVTVRRGESAQATPQCVFRAGRRARVTVLVDSFAQPYQRLQRTQIEDAQQFGPRRLEALPTPIERLGIAAYWFPTESKVMATEGRRLISVFVARVRITGRRARTVAVAVARDYLGANDLRAADPNGT